MILDRIGFAPFVLALAFVVPLPDHGGKSLLGLPDLCPFRNLTGHPCPGCGITRSLVCVAHGHLAAAIHYHPLGPFVFAALLTAALFRLPLPPALRAAANHITSPRHSGFAAVAMVILTLAIWIGRLAGWLPGPP